MTDTHVFLQYKNTDICIDMYCECGYQSHFDGTFANIVKCPHCGELWSMPCILPVKRTSDVDGEEFGEFGEFDGTATGFVSGHQPVLADYAGEEDRWKATP